MGIHCCPLIGGLPRFKRSPRLERPVVVHGGHRPQLQPVVVPHPVYPQSDKIVAVLIHPLNRHKVNVGQRVQVLGVARRNMNLFRLGNEREGVRRQGAT